MTSSELVGELASAPPHSALAFDGDGTLWSGDVGEDFFLALVASGDVRAEATAQLQRVAAAAAIDASGSGAEIARRLYDAYLAGAYPEERICEMMAWILAGRTTTEARTLATRVLGDGFARTRPHPEVLAVVREASRLGHTVWVVSASPRVVVELAAAELGVPSERVLAATTHMRGDIILADVERPIPYGPGKATALTRALAATAGAHGAHGAPGGAPVALEAAFGDNAFDVDMLAMAVRPIAVRPKPRLVERSGAVPGLRQLAIDR